MPFLYVCMCMCAEGVEQSGEGGVKGEGGERRRYIRRLHMLADLKSRHDLTAYLVREEPNPKADC